MRLKIFTLLFSCTIGLFAQEKASISGYIKDGKNGESLIGATVSKMGTNIGTYANEYGFFSIALPKGQHVIEVSLIGYQTFTFSIDLQKSISKTFELSEEGKNLDEVVITGEAEDKNVRSVEMSVAKLDIKQINKIPALLGEVDVIRAIQLLPGVTTVGEGASGFNVRGGKDDQNLFLLDNAVLYNPQHFLGFFSSINPYTAKKATIYTGSIPADLGGRLSSVFDITTKNGNPNAIYRRSKN